MSGHHDIGLRRILTFGSLAISVLVICWTLIQLTMPLAATGSQQQLFDNLVLTPVVRGLEVPVFVTAAVGDSEIFIVQQNGVIVAFEDGETRDVLDLSGRVTYSGEAGLLGLALHPDFLRNGLAYISFTEGHLTSVIAEFRYDRIIQRFDVESEREVFELVQPAGNHNGGMVAFGPDGFLYAGFGDGGGAGDQFGNGQNFKTAHGSIIRIDVGPGAPEPFGVPADNPRPQGVAPEVWVHGVRNPWRFSFDGGKLYIGDVGQSGQEEVDVISVGALSSGLNLGWPLAEGSQCFADPSCREQDIVWPVLTYATREGCAITGGYVYRGRALAGLQGHYFYGDFCNGEVSSFRYVNGVALDQRNLVETLGRVEQLSGFGVDWLGELYVTSLAGTIYRLEYGP